MMTLFFIALFVLILVMALIELEGEHNRKMLDLQQQIDKLNEQLGMLAKQQGYAFWHDGMHPPYWEKKD